MIENALPVLTGPTGTGKSGVAEAVAARTGAVLINLDPFQAYIGLDIGTAKPPLDRRPLYRMLDLWQPSESVDVVRYTDAVRTEIEKVLAQGRAPLLVGGSGFYIQALQQPLDPITENSEMRRQAAVRVQENPLAVWNELQAHRQDFPIPAPGDHYRLEKALLRLATDLNQDVKRIPLPLSFFGIWGEGVRYEKQLAERIQQMLECGWMEEAQRLAKGWGHDAPGLRAIGYRGLAQCQSATSGDISSKILLHTRRYAKRQRTWFRRKPVRWSLASLDGRSRITDRLIQYIDGTFGRNTASDTRT